MIFNKTGKVADDFYVVANSQFPIYLINGAEPVLFEGGVTPVGRMYAESLLSILGSRAPVYLFLTHVHWDHIGAVSYLKKVFPSLVVAASEEAIDILARDTAKKLMTDLNREVEPVIDAAPPVDLSHMLNEDFETFTIDIPLRDGQTIALEDGSIIEIMATPGHTRDLTSYYMPSKKILVACEACGCLDGNGKVSVQFLTDYDSYLASLKRLAAIPADILCQGHRLVFVGRDEVSAYFKKSIQATERFRDKIFSLFDQEKGDIEQVIIRIKTEEWDPIEGVKQPEIPYLINLRAQVSRLLGKCGQ